MQLHSQAAKFAGNEQPENAADLSLVLHQFIVREQQDSCLNLVVFKAHFLLFLTLVNRPYQS